MVESKQNSTNDKRDLPKEWISTSIKELIENNIIEKPLDGNHGNIHPKSTDYVSSGIPFIMASDIEKGIVNLKSCKFISKIQADNLKKGFSREGDVLLTHKGTVGNTAIVPKLRRSYIMLTPQVTYYRVKNKDVIYNKYIKAYFDSNYFQNILTSLSGGGTRAYIGIVKQQYLPFILPSIEEQKYIGDSIMQIDELILSIEKLIKKKKLIKQGIKEELLTGKIRLDGFNEEWEDVYLSDIADFINGTAHENSIVDYGKYTVVNSKFISTSGEIIKYSNHSYCMAQKGDILMVMSDVPNGRAIAKCYIVEENNKYTVNQRVCIIRTNKVISRYLFYILDRNKYYLSFDDGVKQTNLRKDDVIGLKLKIPKLDEQEKIANILWDMDKDIHQLQMKLEKYKNIKNGMMEDLLTGKRRLV